MRIEIGCLLLLASWTGHATQPAQGDYLDVRERSLCEAPPERPDWCEWPRDVRLFVQRYDECEHFLGEEPYDEERRQFLDEAIKQSCKGNDEQLRQLRLTHAGDDALSGVLESLEFNSYSE